jgi:hypothetical protein
MIPAGVERRLRGHVGRVLRSAHVPAAERDELAEELFGHLVEAWETLVQDGLTESAATDRAIRDFGPAERIGRDLTRTYRGRFWASTIGILLPATSSRAPQPRIAWWLGASLRFYGIFAAIATVGIAANATPVRAVVVLVSGVAATAVIFVAAAALGRRQRWALDAAILVNIIGLGYGLWTMATTPRLISLNVFISGILLVAAATERARLGRWVRRSRPISTALSLAILASILGGSASAAMIDGLPDPTQADPDDLHITAWMTCRDDVPQGGTVTVELRWDRLDLLPGGIGRMNGYGDMLVLEMQPLMAAPFGYSTLHDVETGEAVAEPIVIPPAGDRVLENESLNGPAMIGIEHHRLEPGRPYRLTWEFDAWDDVDMRELQAGVEYWHLDDFRVESLIDCDGTVLDWWRVPPAGS